MDNPQQILIERARSESALGSQIREYFTSYCDCDIAEWLIAQLTAHNQEVVDRVNELLAAYDPYPVRREALHPKNGQLVKAFCQGGNKVGYYSINTPTIKNYEFKTIQLNSTECKPYIALDIVKHPNIRSVNDGVEGGSEVGEYRFDVTPTINDYLADKPLIEYASVIDEEGRPVARFLTKIAKNESGQPIGYEINLRSEVVDNNIKIFFNDLVVLDLFFIKKPLVNRIRTAGFWSNSIGYVNHFSVGLKTT